ncbi:hypothetical protein [Acetobacter sp.]|uniref:hypothetical protein n=1 Tax=Acetobacter sp. TaxID=440 RepID=UPI0039E83503
MKLAMTTITVASSESEMTTLAAPEQTTVVDTTGLTVHDLLRFNTALGAGILLPLGAGLLMSSLGINATFIPGMLMDIVGALFGLFSKYLHHTQWG